MSTALEALFASRVYETGRPLRRTTLRHVHLADPPLGIAMWRLGGERFRAAAIAWGPLDAPFNLVVAGEPRNRDLYFAALAPFAADLCARVRRAASIKMERRRGSHTDLIPADALQIVVPNRATVGALRLLGRYLAYLSDRNGIEPDPALIEAGKHLRFYTRHARVPGQSLLVALDRLVAEHWATLLSPFEQSNLAVLDAQIEGSAAMHAFEASTVAEAAARIGPEPTEDIDRVTETLLAEFNSARAGSTNPAVVAELIGPLESHYRTLSSPVWQLMGRTVRREQQLPAALSVARRFEEDRTAFGRHVDWVADGGRYRTRDTPRQAAMTLRRLEDALARYEAEKAIDDPACMIPHLLDGDAIRGTVTSVNVTNVVVRVRAVPRALLALDTDDPVVQPIGKKLWWTSTAGDQHWEVQAVQPRSGGSRVVLMLCARPTADRLPDAGERITFSTLRTQPAGYDLPLQQQPPWTHTPASLPQPPPPIDLGDDQQPAPPVDSTAVPDPGSYA